MKKILVLLFCLVSLTSTPVAVSKANGLILTAPPRESAASGKQLYEPLATHLSKLLGVKVSYQHPGNWLNYQRNMREDKYDIVFDGPHFISWRMAHLKHEVLVKLPGKLDFYLVTNKSHNSPGSLEDLVGKKICGISPPNLSTLTVLDRFRNPVRQPVIKGVKGGMGKVFSAFKEGECEAAVLRSPFYERKMPKADRDNIKILFHSTPLPNQAISVSKRLDKNLKNRIRRSLTKGDGVEASHALVKRFGGKKAKSFILANNNEYEGHNLLLEGVIFGW